MTQITAQSGEIYRITTIHIRVHAEIASAPLSLTPQKYLNVPIAHGSVRNIFPSSGAPEQQVLVTLLKDDQKVTASLLIPKFEGRDTKLFNMSDLPPEPGPQDKKGS